MSINPTENIKKFCEENQFSIIGDFFAIRVCGSNTLEMTIDYKSCSCVITFNGPFKCVVGRVTFEECSMPYEPFSLRLKGFIERLKQTYNLKSYEFQSTCQK